MKNWAYFEERFPSVMAALKGAAVADRLGHSYLLAGSNPDDRLAFPTVLACLTACTDRGPDGAPCETCDTCRQIMDGVYPDLFLLAPTSKAREILIGKDADDPDTLRSFEALFHLSSVTASGWRIGIIQDADTMNENAQNAFLKTLEEPPNKCMFVLTTGRTSGLLPTIRSRCQLLALTDNRCRYDLERFGELPGILFDLQFRGRGNLGVAERSAQRLSALLDSLQEEARKTVAERWASRLENAKNLESAGFKLLERRVAGEEGCEYRRLREQFVSLLHSWFAQTALMAGGMPKEVLPNPEVLSPVFQADPMPVMEEQDLFRMMNLAEKLLSALRTNVSDELAIRTFCLNVAMKS